MTKDRIWTLVSRKLSGEATASELTELEDILKSDANADLYLQAIEEFWNIPPEPDEEFLEATYHLHLNRLKGKGFNLDADKDSNETHDSYFGYITDTPSKGRWKKAFISIAVFSMVAILFYLLFSAEQSAPVLAVDKIAQSEISTKPGSRTKIQLPDGSSVWLNGGSKLVYNNRDFGEKFREVTLTGEAYFDVVKNKDKPFIIHANKINIRVTGTAFNVKAYPGERNIETSLIRGSIEVTIRGRPGEFVMKPNDKLIISNDPTYVDNRITTIKKNGPIVADSMITLMSHLTLGKDDITIQETAWVENKLVFDNEPFEEVALKMERWFGVSIDFADSKLKSERLTGTFEKQTIAEALLALQLSTPFFKYKINNQNVTIFK